MGLLNSKYFEEVSEALPQTPAYRAKPRKVLALDPRSPSDDIVRTPIQVEQTPKIESPDAFMYSEDPRSPTAGMPRTPVAIPEKLARKNGVVGRELKHRMPDQAADKMAKQLFQGRNYTQKSILRSSNSSGDIKTQEAEFKGDQSHTFFNFSGVDKENDPLLDHQQ